MSPDTPPPIPSDRRTFMDELCYDTAPPVVVSLPLVTTPSIVVHELGSRKKKETLGWTTSIALHAVLIALIALLLAPADFGDAARQVIKLTFSDEEDDDLDGATLELSQSDSATSSESLGTTVRLDAIPSPNSSVFGNEGNGSGSESGSSGGGQRGSFFGVQADGHEFVYVLDMSGSMRGARYVRAAAELVKSVNELSSSQRFYVLLFNHSTTQMFGESTILPKSVHATRENKYRLADWLYQIQPNGSTDPRRSLHLALQMNPSAVYMLSDGEFTEDKKKPNRGLFEDDADAYAVVQAAKSDVAIHAIAFEDPSSCKNMQRLATMTSGQYRFVEEGSDELDELLVRAQAAKANGNHDVAVSLLRQLIAASTSSETINSARYELTSMHTRSCNEALDSNDLAELFESLTNLANDDPEAKISQGLQDKLIAAIEDLLTTPVPDQDRPSEDSKVFQFVSSNGKTYAALKFVEPAESMALAQSTQLEADGRLFEACSALCFFKAKYPFIAPSARMTAAMSHISDELFAQAEALQRANKTGETLLCLQKIVDCSVGTDIATNAMSKQKELLFELMAALRDAKVQRDRPKAALIQAEIDHGFRHNAVYLALKNEFLNNELVAKRRLREAQRLDRELSTKDASRIYVAIDDTFPHTLAAKLSRERIREIEFQSDEIASEGDLHVTSAMTPE